MRFQSLSPVSHHKDMVLSVENYKIASPFQARKTALLEPDPSLSGLQLFPFSKQPSPWPTQYLSPPSQWARIFGKCTLGAEHWVGTQNNPILPYHTPLLGAKVSIFQWPTWNFKKNWWCLLFACIFAICIKLCLCGYLSFLSSLCLLCTIPPLSHSSLSKY